MNTHTKQTLTELRNALASAQTIEAAGENYKIKRNQRFTVFPASLFAQLDHRLPVAIDYLLDQRYPNLAKVIRQTMHHWNTPETLLDPIEQIRAYRPTRVRAIDTPTLYGIRVTTYKCFEIAPGVELAVQLNRDNEHYVKKSWLDHNYPGLADKLEMLKTLGENTETSSKMALAAAGLPTESISLPGVAFD